MDLHAGKSSQKDVIEHERKVKTNPQSNLHKALVALAYAQSNARFAPEYKDTTTGMLARERRSLSHFWTSIGIEVRRDLVGRESADTLNTFTSRMRTFTQFEMEALRLGKMSVSADCTTSEETWKAVVNDHMMWALTLSGAQLGKVVDFLASHPFE